MTKYQSFPFDICFYIKDWCLEPIYLLPAIQKRSGFRDYELLLRFIKCRSR